MTILVQDKYWDWTGTGIDYVKPPVLCSEMLPGSTEEVSHISHDFHNQYLGKTDNDRLHSKMNEVYLGHDHKHAVRRLPTFITIICYCMFMSDNAENGY